MKWLPKNAAFRRVTLLFLFWGIWIIRPLAARVMVDGSVTTTGDFNGDGYFDVFDIIQLERIVTLDLTPTAGEIKAMDVDGDGKLTAYDMLVLNSTLGKVNRGERMFEAIKSSIEDDLSKSQDNVETYLDLARFFRKEGILDRSREVLESIREVMDPNHPLFSRVDNFLNSVKDQQLNLVAGPEAEETQDLYQDTDNLTGKVSLRRQVVQLKGRLSDLMKDKMFAAHYNDKRVKSQLGDVMDDMLRSIGEEQMVDPESFSKFNNEVRSVMEDPENMVKSMNNEQKSRLNNIVNQSTTSMRDEAVRLKQAQVALQQASQSELQRQSAPASGATILNRDESRLLQNVRNQNNLANEQQIVANSPSVTPDTISLVAPNYVLKWDVTNVLGAKNAALEISKANLRFSNPRGTVRDTGNTMYYTPSLGSITGERKGSALELEGVGTYQYRIAALNAKGELISRFSDVNELVVVYNNVNIIAQKPSIEPKRISPERPEYTFRWDVSNIEGAKDVGVEVSKPNTTFGNPNGRDRDRNSTFFFNPSLGRLNGTFSSNIDGLAGPGQYLFRVIAVSPYGDFIGQWSDPETLQVSAAGMAEPEPVATPAAPVVPQAPVIETSGEEMSVSWDVSQILGASAVKFELAKPPEGTGGDSTIAPDQVIYTQLIDNTRGAVKLDRDVLQGPGNYVLRIAASDTLGNLLSPWSRLSRLTVSEPAAAPDTLARRVPAESARSAAAVDSLSLERADTVALVQPPVNGKQLVVSTANTPLYSDSNPSSEELQTLKKGEFLVQVRNSPDNFWHYVFYPAGGKYGWVFSFNVRAEE